MQAVVANSNKMKKQFLKFRRKIYKINGNFIDNSYFMIEQAFNNKTSFVKNKEIYPINIVENKKILCQGIIIYSKELPEYIQLCFFESLSNQNKAVKLLIDKAVEYGRKYNCNKIVVGLNGHLNYGLGLLNSNFEEINSFSEPGNPEYYNEYFKNNKFKEEKLNSYIINKIDNRLQMFEKVINKTNNKFTFRTFNKKEFINDAKIYTDLNNETFNNHKYYYKRTYEEDQEMLKELFLFMKKESIIFAFDENKPIGLIMWYPDYNELCKKGDCFGAKHFIKNLFMNKKIKTAKMMEFCVLKEYRKKGLPLGLIDQMGKYFQKYGFQKLETSWVLADNRDSNGVSKKICDSLYKEYVVYEREI